MNIYNENQYPREGWIPEGDPDSGFAQWMDLQGTYNEHENREMATQPLVVPWSQLESRVAEQKTIRDSLRNQGFCFWPWVTAEYFKVGWQDFSQGNRGSCAGCATNHQHLPQLLTADRI